MRYSWSGLSMDNRRCYLCDSLTANCDNLVFLDSCQLVDHEVARSKLLTSSGVVMFPNGQGRRKTSGRVRKPTPAAEQRLFARQAWVLLIANYTAYFEFRNRLSKTLGVMPVVPQASGLNYTGNFESPLWKMCLAFLVQVSDHPDSFFFS